MVKNGTGEPPRKARKLAVEQAKPLLPVTVLCGFLGAGKTSLLKHVLEAKHSEDPSKHFKCAVIVNDMAELNIDKDLIDESALVQSDQVIAMQNGCVCCTLKDDLVVQIIDLASQGTFDYMIIEASGVSEPSEIASLFAECDDSHDHDKEHGNKVSLRDVARLDTCVTVVDAADFLEKLETVRGTASKRESYSQLLVEQVEYANVVIINKTDTVDSAQLATIQEQIELLNPRAEIVCTAWSRADIKHIVGTNKYKASDFEDFAAAFQDTPKQESCCSSRLAVGESPCCKRARSFDTKLSRVTLAPKSSGNTRHASRFGITSMVYTARRPFHPGRFHEDFSRRYFQFVNDEDRDQDGDPEGDDDGNGQSEYVTPEQEALLQDESVPIEEKYDMLQGMYTRLVHEYEGAKAKWAAGAHGNVEDEGEDDDKSGDEDAKKNNALDDGDHAAEDAAAVSTIHQRQQEACEKQKLRTERFGLLLRSKGIVWSAYSHDIIMQLNHAGNMISLDGMNRWNVLATDAWTGDEDTKKRLRKDWSGAYGDRRQELVFIGKNLKHQEIQRALDECLLTDQEFADGVDGWRATFGDILLDGSDDEDDEDEDDEDDDDDDDDDEPEKEDE